MASRCAMRLHRVAGTMSDLAERRDQATARSPTSKPTPTVLCPLLTAGAVSPRLQGEVIVGGICFAGEQLGAAVVATCATENVDRRMSERPSQQSPASELTTEDKIRRQVRNHRGTTVSPTIAVQGEKLGR